MKGKEEEKIKEVDKETQIVNAEKHKENLERELTNASNQVPEVAERKEILLEEIRLNEINDKIVQENFVLEEIKWGFERVPEYIEGVRQLNALSARRRNIQNQDNIYKIDKAMDLLEAQIKGYKEEIERINTKVSELEKGD